MDAYGIQLRQPQPKDLIGIRVAIAAIGTAFEASYGWRLVRGDQELAAGFFQAGSTGLLESFVHEADVHTDHVGPALFQLFGDDPTGERPPGLDTQSVPVIVISGMQGYVLHQVVRGDTLSALARQYGTDVRRLTVANELRDPDRILVGQILRIPQEPGQ
ncbi:LysM peptidoglycan-binding domain-containing protein [Geodermatophilus sp. SYSU D01176]